MDSPRRRADRCERASSDRLNGEAIVWIGVGLILLLTSAALSVIPISSTVETSCGSILSPEFDAPWETQSSCGIAHLGTLALVCTLFITGCVLIVLACLAAKRNSSLNLARWLIRTVAIAAVLATGVLGWRVETWPEPVLRRGWRSVRDATGIIALGLIVIASGADAYARTLRRRSRQAIDIANRY